MTRKFLLIGAFLLMAGGSVRGQRTLEYDQVVVQQNRIDARDLGYPPIDIIPNGESGITALTIAPNGNLYGATSGERSHLFVFYPRHGFVQPLGFLPGTSAVINALVVSSENDVYVGTSPGGHILKYAPRLEDQQPLRIQEPCQVTDLGPAIKGESILTLAIDRRAGVIYGVTYPNAHFFSFTIGTETVTDFGVLAQRATQGERFETEKIVSRMLGLDSQGNVFASGQDGFFFKFDKQKLLLEQLPLRVPGIPGRDPWARVDTFLTLPSGLIFGGTSDGYVFRLDPDRLKVENLGKPLPQYHITGLGLGSNGKIYGVGGDKDDLARMFSYDLGNGTYEVLGFIDVNRRPYYAWQAYVIGAMVTGLDGTIYIGENERVSKLYLYYPL